MFSIGIARNPAQIGTAIQVNALVVTKEKPAE